MKSTPIFDNRKYQAVHEQIRAHYLSFSGKTEAGWIEVAKNPAKFNQVWRHLLKQWASDSPPERYFEQKIHQ